MNTTEHLASEIEASVRAFFEGDEAKVNQWFEIPNQMLGGLRPRTFMHEPGSIKKLRSFVKEAEARNSLVDGRDQVLVAATALSGDANRAEQWIHNHRIDAFQGQTANQLVLEGRAHDVIRYLEMLEVGSLG